MKRLQELQGFSSSTSTIPAAALAPDRRHDPAEGSEGQSRDPRFVPSLLGRLFWSFRKCLWLLCVIE